MSNLAPKDFYKKCEYNQDTQNQLWCSTIADGHDNFCGCGTPFAHLLASIFPPGHTDRKLTIEQILTRDYKEICRSGGREEESHGGAVGGIKEEGPPEEKEEGFIEDEELENLIAAGEDAAGEGTR